MFAYIIFNIQIQKNLSSCWFLIFMISRPMLVQSNPGFAKLSTNVAAVSRKIHMICLYVAQHEIFPYMFIFTVEAFPTF